MGEKCEEGITRPLIPVFMAFMTGIIGADCLPGYGCPILLLAAACFGLIIFKIIRKKDSLFPPLIFLTLLGYLSMAPFSETGFDQRSFSRLSSIEKYMITGIVTEKPYYTGRTTRFTVRVCLLNGRESEFTGKLRVSSPGEIPGLGAGSLVRFESRIKPVRNFLNPGGFDYRRHLRFRGVFGRSRVRGPGVEILSQPLKEGMLSDAEDLRDRFALLVMANSDEGDAAAVLTALIVGKKDWLSEDCKEAFRRSGTAHLLAISGLHTGVVAAFCLALFYLILLRFRFFLWRALAAKTAAFLTIFPVFAYGLLAGFSPSVQRACIMAVVLLLASVMDREADPFNSVAAAALIILVFSPVSLFSISFQLSFAAVCAIIAGMGLVGTRYRSGGSNGKRILLYVLGSAMVSAFAIAGTAPLVIRYFNRISLVGVIANIIITPVVCLMVVPAGLVSLVVMTISPAISSVLIKICLALLSYVMEAVFFLSDLPFSSVSIFTPTIFEMGCYYGLLFTLVHIFKAGAGSLKRKRAFIILGMISAGVLADCTWWINQRFRHKDLRVTALDVGQGCACLLEIPGGFRVLVDGGGFPGIFSLDVGRRVVAPFLWSKRIGYIDMVIMTHPEADHMKGLIYIVDNFKIGEFWSNNQPSRTAGYRKLMAGLAGKDVVHKPFHMLPRQFKRGGVTLNLLHPEKWFKPASGKLKYEGYNNNSLVIRASMGVISFLLPGDIMAETEEKLVESCPGMLNSTVLFSPHHGSRSSSTQGFIDAVNPRIVLISTGWRSRFGMPHETVLERYERLNCRVLRTDVNGAVMFSTMGRTLGISSQR